jgi:ABC-type Na+ transport system ATPase subunit NatA
MMKQVGIIEALKAAKTEKEVVELTKKISEFDQVSDKTVRKFSKIQRKKRAQLRKKNGRKS